MDLDHSRTLLDHFWRFWKKRARGHVSLLPGLVLLFCPCRPQCTCLPQCSPYSIWYMLMKHAHKNTIMLIFVIIIVIIIIVIIIFVYCRLFSGTPCTLKSFVWDVGWDGWWWQYDVGYHLLRLRVCWGGGEQSHHHERPAKDKDLIVPLLWSINISHSFSLADVNHFLAVSSVVPSNLGFT